jgi:uncharacterized protein DUF1353
MKEAIAWIDSENNKRKPRACRHGRCRALYWIKPFPEVKPFGDWDYYYVFGRSLDWEPNKGQTLPKVSVPVGFVTDLTSVPRVFWSLLPRTGRYAYAAIVHDYLYWIQKNAREVADKVLEVAMRDSDVCRQTISAITEAVRLFGQSAWDENKKLKQSGEKRLLKKFPDDPLMSWADWRKNRRHFAD